jgi:hypothetical protein
MPNATVRANARTIPKNKWPPRDMAALDTALARVIPDPGAPALWGRIVRQYSKAEIEAGMVELERLFPRPGEGRAAQ